MWFCGRQKAFKSLSIRTDQLDYHLQKASLYLSSITANLWLTAHSVVLYYLIIAIMLSYTEVYIFFFNLGERARHARGLDNLKPALISNNLKAGTRSRLIKEISIFYIIMPNVTKYTNKFHKKIPQNKIEQVFWERITGLQGWKWIELHPNKLLFLDRMSRNQSCCSGKFWAF